MSDFDEDIAAVGSIKAVPAILNIVCRATGMRFAAVARVTEDRWVACSVRDDVAFGLVAGGELQVETTICHEIRQSGTAVIIDNVANDPAYASHHTPRMYGLQSYISMPIRLADGRFFGTLCAIDPEPHRLNTPEIIEMFTMFADVIGFHLTAVDQVHLTEAKLRDEQQTAALREQFIAVLGHDLRNPVAAVEAGMLLLLNTPLNARATTVVKGVQGSMARMSRLIEDIMDFARGRLGGGVAVRSDAREPLEPVLRQVIGELQTTSPNRLIEARFDVTEPVTCDRGRIAQLLSNLLGNALTYGAEDQPIRIVARTTDSQFELSVANGGTPIPAAVMKTIFEPFSRGTVRPGQEGLGLGLYISHQVATAHRGALDVTSTSEETRFVFRMPLE